MIMYMLRIILILITIISPSLYLKARFNKKVEETIPLVLFSIIIILYICGLIKFLKIGVYFICVISLISFLLFLIKVKKDRIKISQILTPGIILFIFFGIFMSLLHYGRLLSNWDEFSHWGDVVKAMVNINDFSTNKNSLSYFQSYLPAISLFQYFFQVLYGSFNESLLYISYDLIIVSMFLPFTTKLKWNNFWKIIFLLSVVMILPVVFNHNFYCQIYVDSFLGFLFGYILILLYKTERFNLFQVINICIANSVLILTKDIGIVLFGINCLVLLYIYIYNKVKKIEKLNLKQIIIIIIIPIICFLLWKLNVYINKATIQFDQPINIIEAIKTLLRQDTTYKNTVLLNFIDALSNQGIIASPIKLNFYQLIAITIALLYGIIQTKKENNTEKKVIMSIIVVGCILYTFLHFILYISKFTEYEAIRLASYERYIGIYFIAIFMFVGCYLIENFYLCKKLALIFIVLILSLGSINNIFNSFYKLGDSIYMRKQYEKSKEKIELELGEKKKRIYFISQNNNGIDYWILKFVNRNNLATINENGTFSIGLKPYNEEDVFTIIIQPNDWQKELKDKFDYVYLYKIDEEFINSYNGVFEEYTDIENNTLFKVTSEGKLVKVR